MLRESSTSFFPRKLPTECVNENDLGTHTIFTKRNLKTKKKIRNIFYSFIPIKVYKHHINEIFFIENYRKLYETRLYILCFYRQNIFVT